jgi:hypothetical protein
VVGTPRRGVLVSGSTTSKNLVMPPALRQHRPVRLPLVLFIAAAGVVFTGCQSTFTKFRVTNYRDELVAEWTARGFVIPLERGYSITAVERKSGPPFSVLSRYPDGWETVVTGPHIHHWRCPKPQWLAEYEGDVPVVPPAATRKSVAVSLPAR